MKLFILSIAILSSLCSAQIQKPEEKIISPDFLFPAAWDYQVKLYQFQGEVDAMIGEVVTAVSQVLAKSTNETLGQYESHVSRIEDLYAPSLVTFQELSPGACRNSAERILNETTTFTGFSASNCANHYDIRVTVEVDKVNKALSDFDDIFHQVQSFVVRAFVGKNVFLTPEDILDRIEDIYELIRGKWDTSKPQISTLRDGLKTGINNQNVELGKCHARIEDDAVIEFQRFARMVQTCWDFENSRFSDLFSHTRASGSFEQQLEEFLVEHAKLKLYEWTA